ncbi:uncharacterized protein A1O9_11134 [Exophiala aquamarina CBS 119918]|uniref:Transcriptional regulatory protein RXT2 N-terminal domain-containing protein n=1 Tax=Exophiala aquamarina CBS 119918 TaxID=1182545 RepID=A0A072NZ76_9EURO|nr:uncharacterized protein A1O9_11134 [Exophiala aquamarina CBS 119918]KEF52717.1 hypothetical protein A1O9_11134 [Exophiala aquamarina CBS 119918]
MPPQHVEIAETIAALKRAIRREKEAPTEQPMHGATNRGNKLRYGANYVHTGALPYPHGAEGYKQKIEHAGYTRYILDRNPRRYNEYGDELNDSESDTEADEDANDENPYSGIRIEELLAPLKHPSDLANHPTLSLPFLDSALPDMLRSTEDKLRQERANLWRAKNQNRQFIGDESWIPSHVTEGVDDWDLFEPKPRLPALSPRKKRKTASRNETLRNGVGHGYATADGHTSRVGQDTMGNNQLSPKDISTKEIADTGETGDVPVEHLVAMDVDMSAADPPTTNGVHQDANSTEDKGASNKSLKQIQNGDVHETADKTDTETKEQDDDQRSEDGTPPQHTRRITRALAAEQEGSNVTSIPDSPHTSTSTINSSLLQPDPFFLLPPSLAANHRTPRHLDRLGLPVEEFLETRRLLTMYIQKQEESVRGYEALLGKLTRAKRMRDKVWEWCKAEGHVGEWSDGEDWIDAEAWGLQPEELKKGKDEEEVEGQEDTGRKGKRRRRD